MPEFDPDSEPWVDMPLRFELCRKWQNRMDRKRALKSVREVYRRMADTAELNEAEKYYVHRYCMWKVVPRLKKERIKS